MKVTFDLKRLLHLIILITLTVTVGRHLIEHYEWKPLSAYGMSCSLVCQISNVLLKLYEMTSEAVEESRNDDITRMRKKIKKKKTQSRRE